MSIVGYKLRASILKDQGYSSYPEYLNSGLWASIRRRVLKRDKWACRVCGKQAWQVHHRNYDRRTMAGKSLKKLISLCGDCHKKVEFSGSNKRPFASAQLVLRGLLKGISPSPPPPKKKYKPDPFLLCGWDSYGHYITSDEWHHLRDKVLQERAECELCSAPATRVHHAHCGVKTLRGENLSTLIALCPRCFEKILFTRKNQVRRSFKESMAVLRSKLRGRNKRK